MTGKERAWRRTAGNHGWIGGTNVAMGDAQEIVSFTCRQIVRHAGTAMLAQANQVPRGVISLLWRRVGEGGVRTTGRRLPPSSVPPAVSTAAPAQLVLSLYDGAVSSVRQAEAVLSRPGGAAPSAWAHAELGRAEAILTELSVTLDRSQGGIAAGLDGLYDFCLDRLVAARPSDDPGELAAVASVLAQLRDAWAEACCGATAQVS